MTRRRRYPRAFTLVELLLAAIITALVAGATTVALSQMARAKNGSEARQEAMSRADAAAARIALDVATIVRDEDLSIARVAVKDGGTPGAEADELLLITRSLRRVRGLPESPEGADFEVQYRLGADGDGPALWRRVDPALDDYPDAGGVATPVAQGVVRLSVEANDGTNWVSAWDSDSDGYPYGIRVAVTAQDSGKRATVTVRKLIALDRTPPPPASADDTGSTTGSTPPSSSGSAANGGGR
jgi:type II secretion system protein J